jgi:catechol 2,3-dioxygenase-like lactoylglutathione lyase family enzyme
LDSGISKVDCVGIPSRNTEHSRKFYVETLGLRPDARSSNEFWVGDTCFAIWEPARFGAEFAPQANSVVLLHVDDVATARAELENRGVEFVGETLDTGVCHMADFLDPDGNQLTLHRRYAPYRDGTTP